jgi:GT2 family glycosyltransferase
VFVLRLPKNSGYTNATNQGILWAGDRYKYLHLQNNDIEPEQDYIKKLYDVMEEDSVIGIASSVRILPSHPVHNIELYGVDLIRGYQQMTNGDIKERIIHTHWVPLCSALVRHETIRYIGLLDRRMIMWCSDNDLCIRCNFAGWNVSLVMDSRVIHHHNVTTGNSNEAGVSRDQKVLLEKIANMQYAKLMNELPLDKESNTYGKLEFSIYKK